MGTTTASRATRYPTYLLLLLVVVALPDFTGFASAADEKPPVVKEGDEGPAVETLRAPPERPSRSFPRVERRR